MATYWTVWSCGGIYHQCSAHRSVKAARKAARECEKTGGAKHRIVKLVPVRR